MGSQSETGHAKNVANFNDLLTRLAALGNTYNPSLPELNLAAMQIQKVASSDAMKQLSEAQALYNTAIDANNAAFAPVKDIVARSMGIFKLSVTDAAQVESAESLSRKIRKLPTPKKRKQAEESASKADTTAEATPQQKTHSTSQQSYDMIIENLSRYTDTLKVNSAYSPNEHELSVAGLMELVDRLNSTSEAIITASAQLNAARSHRNAVLYTPVTGMAYVGKRAVEYVKSVIPKSNVERAHILKIRFRTEY